MCKKNNKKKGYEFFKSPIIENYKNFTLNQIMDAFQARFDEETLLNGDLDDIKFYRSSVESIRHLFKLIPFDMQKPLGISLIRCLKDTYCDGELSSPKRGFFAAVIYVSFEYLKEDDEAFRTAFCTFDGKDGICHSFCRFVILASIEYYCRVKRRDTAEFYKIIIKFDSEVVRNIKNTPEEQVFKLIWMEWCKNNYKLGVDTYMNFINESYINSLYWIVRHPIGNMILS